MAERNIRVRFSSRDEVSGDLRRMSTEARRTDRTFDSFRATVAALGLGLLARRIASVAGELFSLGAQVTATRNRFRTVFGDSARILDEFGDEFADLAGISESTFQNLAASTGAIAQSMGFARAESAGFAEEVVRLSGDIASFNNLQTERVLQKINSALVGEREGLKEVNIALLDSEVDHRALQIAMERGARTATRQDRAFASLQLIAEKAGVAVGDLGRTADETDNVLKQIGGSFQTIRERIGAFLTESPLANEALREIRDVLRDMGKILAGNEDVVATGFLALGQLAGASFGVGLSEALETTMRETFVLGRLPGAVGEFFDRINLGAKAFEALGSAARESMRDAREALRVLANAGPRLGPLAAGAGGGGGTASGSAGRVSARITQSAPGQVPLPAPAIPVLEATQPALVHEPIDLVEPLQPRFEEFAAEVGRIGERVGHSLVEGIIQGTADLGDLLKSFLASFASKFIFGPLAGFLGLGSPSRVTAEMGRDLSLGLVVGMESLAGTVARSAENVAGRALDGFRLAELSPVGVGSSRLVEARLTPTGPMDAFLFKLIENTYLELRTAGAL